MCLPHPLPRPRHCPGCWREWSLSSVASRTLFVVSCGTKEWRWGQSTRQTGIPLAHIWCTFCLHFVCVLLYFVLLYFACYSILCYSILCVTLFCVLLSLVVLFQIHQNSTRSKVSWLFGNSRTFDSVTDFVFRERWSDHEEGVASRLSCQEKKTSRKTVRKIHCITVARGGGHVMFTLHHCS